jgi:hypothetical protein
MECDDDVGATDLALTPAQRADLDRRIEEARLVKAVFIPGDEAFAALRERRSPMKASIEGTGPGEQAARNLTFTKLVNGRLSVWIHPPGAKDGGYEIHVWPSALRDALSCLEVLDTKKQR